MAEQLFYTFLVLIPPFFILSAAAADENEDYEGQPTLAIVYFAVVYISGWGVVISALAWIWGF